VVEVAEGVDVVEPAARFNLHVEVAAKHAVSGILTGVERDVQTSRVTDRAARAGVRDRAQNAALNGCSAAVGGAVALLDVAGFELSGDITADLQAGVASRDDKAGHAADVTNLNIFRRRGLLCGKIGGLRGGDGDDAGSRTEQNALNERHYDLQC
jgi:hypothetical protein